MPITAEGEVRPEGTRFTVSDMSACSSDLLHDWLRVARHMVSDLEHELARRSHTTRSASAPAPDVIGIAEFCERRSMKYSYAVRAWRKLGGFKDVDGKIKFKASSCATASRPPRA